MTKLLVRLAKALGLFASLLAVCASAQVMQQGIVHTHAPAAASGVTLVHSWGNNYSGCLGVTSCVYTLGNDPASGDLIVIGVDTGSPNTLSAASTTGAGCPSSWSQTATTNSGGSPQVWMFYGVAAGSGSCEITITGTVANNLGITGVELSGQQASPIDAFGVNNTTSSTTMTVTAGNATTASGDYAVVLWSSQNATTTTAAAGFTALQNFSYDGNLGEPSISNGTTVSAAISNLPASGTNSAYLVVVK